MKKNIVDFICSLHGYQIRVKEIHWNTTINAEHLLCDEIIDTVHVLLKPGLENFKHYFTSM